MRKNNENRNFEGRNLSLLTDLYQFTMMQGYYEEYKDDIETKVIFDGFYRSNPFGSGYAICCGLDSVIDYIENLHFEEEDIATLKDTGYFSEEFLNYLSNFTFTGDIYSVQEGSIIFPQIPFVKVVAPIMEAQLIETAMLNLFNHQSLIATKAARVRNAVGQSDSLMEFGLRRAQGPDAGTLGARAAVIGGCDGTSNVLCKKLYGCKIMGTHAHSWIMSHHSEEEAFEKYARMYPQNAILLVDTYDTLHSGVPMAIKVFKKLKAEGINFGTYGIRLDSGDLAYLSKKVYQMFCEAGLEGATICASNDLDETIIRSLKLQGAKVNSWGVGTNLITAKDCPAFGGVYKLSAIFENGNWTPKIKLSEDVIKTTNPGNKKVYRFIDKQTGKYIADMIALQEENLTEDKPVRLFDQVDTYKEKILQPGTFEIKELLVPIFKNGKCIYERPSMQDVKAYCEEEKARLWDEVTRFENPHQYYVDLSDGLYALKKEMRNSNRH